MQALRTWQRRPILGRGKLFLDLAQASELSALIESQIVLHCSCSPDDRGTPSEHRASVTQAEVLRILNMAPSGSRLCSLGAMCGLVYETGNLRKCVGMCPAVSNSFWSPNSNKGERRGCAACGTCVICDMWRRRERSSLEERRPAEGERERSFSDYLSVMEGPKAARRRQLANLYQVCTPCVIYVTA